MSPWANYKAALAAVSARTGAPLPSLVLSFAILHEATAIVPLVAVFYGSRSLGIGESVVQAIVADPTAQDTFRVRKTVQGWVEEGDAWAGRVGRRYGIFGYEKQAGPDINAEPSQISRPLAGDVANAIVAYGVTKALLPVRVGLSLYLSPVFSRRIIEPIRKSLVHSFHRKS